MITFAGKNIPEFIKTTGIEFSILPPVESKTLKIQGRPGVYDFGVELGPRVIKLNVKLISDEPNGVIKLSSELAEWLYYEDLQPLILHDEPDKVYMARVSGETNFTEILRVGEGALEFFCPSPFKEAIEAKETKAAASGRSSTIISVENAGTTKTFPEIELTVKKDSSIAVVQSDAGPFIQLGEDATDRQQVVKTEEIIVDDKATSVNGWTTPVEQNCELTGEIISDGSSFRLKDDKYGEAAWKWHGGGLLKALPREVQDFDIKVEFEWGSSDVAHRGKVEFDVMDKNNMNILRFGICDSTMNTQHPYFYVQQGKGLSTPISYLPKWKPLWSWFTGYIQISRRGTWYSAYITVVDPKSGFEHSGQYFEWRDPDGIYNKPVLKYQFCIATFDNGPGYPNTKVKKTRFTDAKPLPDMSIPIIFKTGDKLHIDCERAIVRHNGRVAYQFLNPSSDFFALAKGGNKLTVSPGFIDVAVKHKERWL
ncbi:hypothetical protein CN610_19855 [Bacillus wiedmannii]|nr:hypothetical protein CN610_19855 [Bacillus wiedmannii]